jgi:hypothetical protein
MKRTLGLSLLPLLLIVSAAMAKLPPYPGEEPSGFQGAPWGSSSQNVKDVTKPSTWAKLPSDNSFPKEMNIERYSGKQSVAGYAATVTYYFLDDKLVQATIAFDFDQLKNFDFNYNVFISVDKYYTAIHDQTLTFIADIYELLKKKYGKKEPVFKELDPRNMFVKLDKYLNQERWNMRYNPSEYHKRIIASAYARWDFPQTTAIFSINISAADKRFDYVLSLSSVELSPKVLEMKDSLRMRGL